MSDLAQEARDYYAAMRGEMVLDKDKHDTIKENGKTEIVNLVPQALANLQYLMEHSDSETVRWNATKFILENGLYGRNPEEDELERLVRSLKKPVPDSAT